MHRHLPEPAPLARLRHALAALPSGLPTSGACALAAAALIVPVVTLQALPRDDRGPASHRPPDRDRVALTERPTAAGLQSEEPQPDSGEADGAGDATRPTCSSPGGCVSTSIVTAPGSDDDRQATGNSSTPEPTVASHSPDPEQHSRGGGDDDEASDDQDWHRSAHPSEPPDAAPSTEPDDDPAPGDEPIDP